MEDMKRQLILIIMLLSCFLSAGAGAQDDTIDMDNLDWTDNWQCYDYSDYLKENVLVELRSTSFSDIAKSRSLPVDEHELQGLAEQVGIGRVELSGIAHRALYSVSGLSREWAFGRGFGSENFSYAFIIHPDGTGVYYDFTGLKEGEKTTPRGLYQCEIVK